MTLVVKGIKQCCDTPVEETSLSSKVMCGGIRRKKPNSGEIEKILTLQDNKCLYCRKPFGTPYVRNGKISMTKLCFDHLIPYSYAQSNRNNFVAACNICNGIKSNLMFVSVEEAYHYVEHRRKKKGYTYYEDLPAVQEKIQA